MVETDFFLSGPGLNFSIISIREDNIIKINIIIINDKDTLLLLFLSQHFDILSRELEWYKMLCKGKLLRPISILTKKYTAKGLVII